MRRGSIDWGGPLIVVLLLASRCCSCPDGTTSPRHRHRPRGLRVPGGAGRCSGIAARSYAYATSLRRRRFLELGVSEFGMWPNSFPSPLSNSPIPTSTVRGTFSGTAFSITRRRAPRFHRRLPSGPRRAARRGRSGSSGLRRRDRGKRLVDVDHRLLQDVGGASLDREVHGHALGRGSHLIVPAVQIGHQPAAAEHRLHHAGLARLRAGRR